jgi:hypothetical protein
MAATWVEKQPRPWGGETAQALLEKAVELVLQAGIEHAAQVQLMLARRLCGIHGSAQERQCGRRPRPWAAV